MTAYGCGLRRLEVVNLRIRDLDSSRMVVRVHPRQGPEWTATSPLSPMLLEALRAYWREYRPADVLFPRRERERADQNRVPSARFAPTFAPRRGCARPCRCTRFAIALRPTTWRPVRTLRTLQVILGHNSLRTTSIYLHVSTDRIRNAPSPLDLLDAIE